MKSLVYMILLAFLFSGCFKSKQEYDELPPGPLTSTLGFDYLIFQGTPTPGHFTASGIKPPVNHPISHYKFEWAAAEKSSDFGVQYLGISANLPLDSSITKSIFFGFEIRADKTGAYIIDSGSGAFKFLEQGHTVDTYGITSGTVVITTFKKYRLQSTTIYRITGIFSTIGYNNSINSEIRITNGSFDLWTQ